MLLDICPFVRTRLFAAGIGKRSWEIICPAVEAACCEAASSIALRWRSSRTHEDGTFPATVDAAADSSSVNDVAILIHGLAGSHSSAYMPLRCSTKLRQPGGITVMRMDLRGCGEV